MKDSKSKRYGIIIDTAKCYDCKACMIACKVENDVPGGYWRNWVLPSSGDDEVRTQYQPGQCMQCESPSCVAACPVGATYKQKDGLVVIDPVKCIGCGNCVTACPYGARYRDPINRIADKCDFCAHRLKRGEIPTCVETCPTKARVFGDLNDPESTISKLAEMVKPVQIVNPLVNTNPNIYYTRGTTLIDWPVVPTLPGGEHMPPEFWKSYG